MNTKRCPKCDIRLLLFADYDRNNIDALGVKCGKCGYRYSMKDAMDRIRSIENQNAELRLLVDVLRRKR